MNLIDLDFLEIGTSDFDTLIELANDRTVGITVEPVKRYLDRLPDKPGVIKTCVAISDKPGVGEVYYLPEEKIVEFGFMKDYRGCNTLNEPHPTVLNQLKSLGKDESEFLKTRIPVLTYQNLIDAYGIRSVRYCKINTEGHDCKILNSMLNADRAKPQKIKFESNALVDPTELKETIRRMESNGYFILGQDRHDTVMALQELKTGIGSET